MKEIYSSGRLVVTKSIVNGRYTFHANRIPILVTTTEGAVELARAILAEEEKEITQHEYDLRKANPYDLNDVAKLTRKEE